MKKLFFAVSIFFLQVLYAQTDERAIFTQIEVNAPVSKVWNAWTTEEGVKTFFSPGANIQLKPFGPYEIYFMPEAEPGMRGADEMIVIGFQENSMLTFTWNAPPSLPEARKQRTFVIVRMEEIDANKTKVKLTHTGWGKGGEWDKAFDYFSKAWTNTVLPRLKYSLEKGPIDWKNPPELNK